ncbi:MAG: hypothetical protein R2722_17545 [Tessaracoccus sp.]
MSEVRLPALTGDSPLGILAAIGVLRLLSDFTDDKPQLSWTPRGYTAVLHSHHLTVDHVVADLRAVVDGISDGSVLPGVGAGFPPPGAAPDRLRMPQTRLREASESLLSHMAENEQSEVRRWLASLVTDLAADDKGRAAISQFTAPSGKQSMATMLTSPLTDVRKQSDYLRQALVGWRRVPGTTGEYLDHRAMWDAAEDGAGSANMRGVPGATWLALMSYPLLRTTASPRRRPLSSGWHTVSAGRRSYNELRLPVWDHPLTPSAVAVLIEHPALADCVDRQTGKLTITSELRALGVVHVCRARRYQAPGGQSAGVLKTVLS